MKDLLAQLDKAFESRIRFAVMLVLVSSKSADFSTLKSLSATTDGNLATHLKHLERVGYIGVRKSFVDRKPNTRYSATKIGQRAFRRHLEALKRLMGLIS